MFCSDDLLITLFILMIFVKLLGLSDNILPKEKFTNSGLNMSNRRCMELAEYYHPRKYSSKRQKMLNATRICGYPRRYSIDERTGNYFNSYGAYNIPVDHRNSKYI